MKNIRTVFLLCFAFALSDAGAEETILKIGSQTILAEIADTPQSRKHGLMQRSHLCDDCGMLFVFEKADRYSFWMKNTPLPLSIAFISTDGSIINIEEMLPDTTDTHDSLGEAMYVLEMNSGWFTRNHIVSADKVQGLKFAIKPH